MLRQRHIVLACSTKQGQCHVPWLSSLHIPGARAVPRACAQRSMPGAENHAKTNTSGPQAYQQGSPPEQGSVAGNVATNKWCSSNLRSRLHLAGSRPPTGMRGMRVKAQHACDHPGSSRSRRAQ